MPDTDDILKNCLDWLGNLKRRIFLKPLLIPKKIGYSIVIRKLKNSKSPKFGRIYNIIDYIIELSANLKPKGIVN